MKRELKAGAGATLLLAAAASITLIGGAQSSSAAGVPSSAYGVSAEGLVAIPKTPFVASNDGSLVESDLVDVPLGPLGDGVTAVSVWAENDRAGIKIADVSVAGDLLANLDAVLQPLSDACTQILTPIDSALPLDTILSPTQLDPLLGPVSDVVATLGNALGTSSTPLDETLSGLTVGSLTDICDTLANPITEIVGVEGIETSCQDTTGTVNIAKLNVLGLDVNIPSTQPNTVIDLSPIAKVTINEQGTNADGTFTVNGVKLEVLPNASGEAVQTLTLGSATCGHVTADRTPGPAPSAPSPTPVVTNVPVTG